MSKITDPIADYLTRLRNGIKANHRIVDVPASNLKKAITEIKKLKAEFWQDLKITGDKDQVNPELEKAGRVADFLELGELMARDALMRPESCGGHFRVESQTEEGEAKRNDEEYAHGAVWEFKGENQDPERHKEELTFEHVPLTQRSYK